MPGSSSPATAASPNTSSSSSSSSSSTTCEPDQVPRPPPLPPPPQSSSSSPSGTPDLMGLLLTKPTSRGGSSSVCSAVPSTIDSEVEALATGFSRVVKLLTEERARIAEERESLQRERQEFERLREKVKAVNAMKDSKVLLNVGGTTYQTTVDTLCAEEGSMLDAMFSGKYGLELDPETGACFLDRDDTFFSLILSYLRAKKDGTPLKKLPLDAPSAEKMMHEANFYGLTGLERLLAASTSLVVAQDGTGKYTRIQDALKDAREGDRILVQPGTYFECLYIDKNVEIVGDAPPFSCGGGVGMGSPCACLKKKKGFSTTAYAPPGPCELCSGASPGRAQVVLTYAGEHVVTSCGETPQLRNIVINQQGDEYHCLFITAGCLSVDGCTFTSSGWACIGISGENTHPFLTNNHIVSSTDNGVIILSRGKGVIAHNNIEGFTLQGIEIREGSNPVIRNNRIHHGDDSGIYINTKGKGVIENNHIYSNAFNGIAVKFEGQPKKVSNNVICDNKHMGIFVAVDSSAEGIDSTNEVHDNASGNMVEEHAYKAD